MRNLRRGVVQRGGKAKTGKSKHVGSAGHITARAGNAPAQGVCMDTSCCT